MLRRLTIVFCSALTAACSVSDHEDAGNGPGIDDVDDDGSSSWGSAESDASATTPATGSPESSGGESVGSSTSETGTGSDTGDSSGGDACDGSPDGDGIDLPANTWVEVTPSIDAPAGGRFRERGYTSMIYSACSGQVMSWEGYIDDQTWFPTIYSNALWTYDTAANELALLKPNNWTKPGSSTMPLPENDTDPTPMDRHPYGCFTDAPARGGFFIFGGANQTTGAGHPNDTWRFDVDSNAWVELSPATSPPPMLEAAMSYHESDDVLVLHGNPSGGEGRTFVYDFAANTWTEDTDGGGPGVKSGTRMVYDPLREVVVMFGGGAFAVGGNELWTYSPSGGGWTRIDAAGPPGFRRRHGFVYDSQRDLFVVFGGNNPSSGQDLDDTWIYEPVASSWANAAPAVSPPRSAHVDMAYDPIADVVVARLNERWWLYRCPG